MEKTKEDKDLQAYLERFAKVVGLPVEELEKAYIEKLEDEESRHPEMTDQERVKRARARLRTTYRRRMFDPSEQFNGIILGADEPRDWTESYRRRTIDEYNKNQEETVRLGKVRREIAEDSDGKKYEKVIVVDLREVFPSSGKKNPNFKKEYPSDRWLRTIIGVAAKKNGKAKPKFFSMSMSDKIARESKFEMYKPIYFNARMNSKDSDKELKLGSTSSTRFEIAPDDDPLWKVTIDKAILSLCSKYILPLADLEEYHDANRTNWDRLSICEVDVVRMHLEPVKNTGNRILTVDDESLSFAEDTKYKSGVTVWVPPHIELDFGVESKVYVIGRTSQSKKKETGEWGDVQINALGVWADPLYKMDAEVEKVSEDSGDVSLTKPKELKLKEDDWE